MRTYVVPCVLSVARHVKPVYLSLSQVQIITVNIEQVFYGFCIIFIKYDVTDDMLAF